jgi:hypothetical protein
MRAFSRPALEVTRNEGGSPAVEFALAAPVLLLLTAAIIEFGMIMFVTVLMEGGLREASRYGITGRRPRTGTGPREVVADRTLGLVDVTKASVKITAYPTFDDVGRGEDFVDGNSNGTYDNGETFKDCNDNGKRDNDRGKSDAGASGDVVVYQIDYDWPLLTSLMTPIIGKDGKFHVQASGVVRNEPWDGSAAGTEHPNCNL